MHPFKFCIHQQFGCKDILAWKEKFSFLCEYTYRQLWNKGFYRGAEFLIFNTLFIEFGWWKVRVIELNEKFVSSVHTLDTDINEQTDWFLADE